MASTVSKCCLKETYVTELEICLVFQDKESKELSGGKKTFYKKKKSAFDLKEQNNENPRLIKTRGLQATLEKTNKYR